jgi:hypothetical protein
MKIRQDIDSLPTEKQEAVLEAYLTSLVQPRKPREIVASRAEALAYRDALLASRKGDFKVALAVWDANSKKYSKRDYIELIKPIVDEDLALVNRIRAIAMRKGYALQHKSLPRPVTTRPAFMTWRGFFSSSPVTSPKFAVVDGVISNTVTK